ncbi:hypothetical protein V3M63_06655 [Trueperella pyogenes]|uniref:hypothetical protein n=1 Tax=Trueperella pyogenes TaxID=1661 RepID=UPI00345D268D
MEPDDFDVRDFARILRKLPAHLPISDSFEAADPQKKELWWTSQREHMVRWFEKQPTTGEGKFTRKTPNYSAKKAYVNLKHTEGYIWMAEALGVDPALVQEAADKALELPRGQRWTFVRNNYLPWSLITEHAKFRRG